MSGLNTYFIPLTILQEQFWDKLTDAPMAGGKLYFYQDEARTIPKPVYVLTGNPPDYSYAEASPSAYCITLSSIGTVDDGLGNNLVIYGYPYDDELFDGSGNIQLYYMAVYNSDDQFQFAVSGFPNVPFEESVMSSGREKNFIKNGQFVLNNGTQAISATSTEVAYGGWYYVRSSNTATDVVSFTRFGSPISGGVPSGNPRYACNVECSVTGADSSKVLEIEFNDVNRFSDPSQTLTLFFMAKSASSSSITVNLYKNFGTGGSAPITTQIVESTALTSSWQPIEVSFPFGSNVGYALGPNDDDYFSIQVSFNPALTFNVSVTDFILYLGTERITAYPFGPDSYNDLQIYNILNYVPPYYFASGSVSPIPVTTNNQLVPNALITLPIGTYMISYTVTCTITIALNGPAHQYRLFSWLNNQTTNSIVPDTYFIIDDIYVQANSINIGCGNVSQTVVLNLTTPTTFQIAFKIDDVAGVLGTPGSSLANGTVTAIKMGIKP